MARVQKLVIRLDTEIYDQLKLVSETRRVPMNKLVQRAVAESLARESRRLADELSPRLEKLRRYAAKSAGLEDALEMLAKDEAAHAHDDPAEGRRASAATSATGATKKTMKA